MSQPPIPPTEPISGTVEAQTETGAPVVSPLEGKTTIDDSLVFETEILAHESAGVIAERIVAEVKKIADSRKPCTVLFLDENLALALGLYRAFNQQCAILVTAFEAAVNRAKLGLNGLEAPVEDEEKRSDKVEDRSEDEKRRSVELSFAAGALAQIAAATGIVSTAVDLLGFFNVDTSYYGRAAKVSQRALVMELARVLLPYERIVFRWPSLGIVARAGPKPYGDPVGLGSLIKVGVSQDEAVEWIHKLAVKVYNLDDDDPKLPPARLALDRAHEAYDSANAVFSELRETFLRNEGEAGTSPAFLLQMASDVLETDGQPAKPVFFLTANVETAGGSYRIRRHLFQAITFKDPLSYSGGCIVSFALLDNLGNFVAAGTMRHGERYREDYDIPERPRQIPKRTGWWRKRLTRRTDRPLLN